MEVRRRDYESLNATVPVSWRFLNESHVCDLRCDDRRGAGHRPHGGRCPKLSSQVLLPQGVLRRSGPVRSGVRRPGPGSLRGPGPLRSGLRRELLQVQVPLQAALPKLLPVSELLLSPGPLRSVRCGSGPLRRSVRRPGSVCSRLWRMLLQVQVQVP